MFFPSTVGTDCCATSPFSSALLSGSGIPPVDFQPCSCNDHKDGGFLLFEGWFGSWPQRVSPVGCSSCKFHVPNSPWAMESWHFQDEKFHGKFPFRWPCESAFGYISSMKICGEISQDRVTPRCMNF